MRIVGGLHGSDLKRLLATIGLGMLASFLLAATASARPAALDSTFGDGGKVLLRSEVTGYEYQEAREMAIAPGGAIYVLESPSRCSQRGCATDLIVSRYTANGFIDTSFGGGTGSVLVIAREPGDRTRGMLAVDPRGRAVVATLEGRNLGAVRLLSDGSFDPSFGTDGKVSDRCDCFPGLEALKVDRAGRVFVMGARFALPGYRSYEDESDVVRFVRLTSAGELDPAFGVSGHVDVHVPKRNEGSTRFALDARGRPLVATVDCCAELRQLFVRRISLDGRLDGRFARRNREAIATVRGRLGDFPILVSAVLPRSGAGIDVFGQTPSHGYAMRFLADGRLDPRFGRRGVKRLGIRVIDASVDARGRDFVLGFDARRQRIVRRLQVNGLLDKSFGGNLPSPFAGIDETIQAQRGNRPVLFNQGRGYGCRSYCSPEPRLIRLAVRAEHQQRQHSH